MLSCQRRNLRFRSCPIEPEKAAIWDVCLKIAEFQRETANQLHSPGIIIQTCLAVPTAHFRLAHLDVETYGRGR